MDLESIKALRIVVADETIDVEIKKSLLLDIIDFGIAAMEQVKMLARGGGGGGSGRSA